MSQCLKRVESKQSGREFVTAHIVSLAGVAFAVAALTTLLVAVLR
ncbi:hypothetical protein PPN31114_00702 [Pandoraea pneumonica]|uniref:Uncharacterized protein n=1 Tax=Pandoraea pneumonica TaxID=2508299 RepID=A0A5E4SAQ1_9BURK|nr:hypothetical protein [Pandoraea pneumonica]VVD72926.1 hypothetical protein PPN31114_00702 [Pandoraea pneumonica]